MVFEFGFYSSILLISFSQGIIFSFLLLFKAIQTENKSNYWLGFFVLLCSLYIAPWMLGFAGWYDNQPYRDIMFYIPFQHLFLVGPVIFFYTQSLLNPSFQLKKKDWFHFLPAIIYVLYIIIIWIYDQFIFGDYYFYKDGIDKDFDNWYQKIGLVSMIIYFLLSLKYYTIYKKLIYQMVSFADVLLFKWIKTYLIAFLMMLLLPVLFDILSLFFPEINSYQGSWWFFLFFSIIMYYIAISGYSNPINSKIPFKLNGFTNNQVLLDYNFKSKAEENSIDIDFEIDESNLSIEILNWKLQIIELMEEQNLHYNPELSLTDLAKLLNTNISIISKTINQGFQMNFNDFVNNYRIESVKKAFESGEHKKTTLLGIAYDCGFNSKATFNRAFKKNTGFTPKEFLEKT